MWEHLVYRSNLFTDKKYIKILKKDRVRVTEIHLGLSTVSNKKHKEKKKTEK